MVNEFFHPKKSLLIKLNGARLMMPGQWCLGKHQETTMSAKIYDWFEEKAKRLQLHTVTARNRPSQEQILLEHLRAKATLYALVARQLQQNKLD